MDRTITNEYGAEKTIGEVELGFRVLSKLATPPPTVDPSWLYTLPEQFQTGER